MIHLYLAGKVGEELLHEVAFRYVEGMNDMEGRKPGPSSILGMQQHRALKNIFLYFLSTDVSTKNVHNREKDPAISPGATWDHE